MSDDKPPVPPPGDGTGIPNFLIDSMINAFMTMVIQRLPRAAKLKLAGELHKLLWPEAHAADARPTEPPKDS